MINRPTIDSAPATSAGRPETAVPKATSCWPVSHISSCAQAACSTVLTVVWCERASSPRARVVSAGTRNDSTPRRPSPNRPGGPTRVGVSKPANTSRQAAWAASRSRPASQVTNRRYGAGRGQPLPVIAGEYFPQQDRQRPAIDHDVVISEHKPVPVFCGADQSRPKGRRVGEVADRGAFGGAHPLDLLLDIDIDVGASVSSSTYRHAATGSAGMICTGSSNWCAESGRQVRDGG